MKRPIKPHRDGYEDEEDCEGHYDPDEADRRRCHPSWASRGRSSNDPCQICFEAWKTKESVKRKAEWDAKTPEEKEAHEKLVKGLRELY